MCLLSCDWEIIQTKEKVSKGLTFKHQLKLNEKVGQGETGKYVLGTRDDKHLVEVRQRVNLVRKQGLCIHQTEYKLRCRKHKLFPEP